MNNSRWRVNTFGEPYDANGKPLRLRGQLQLTPEERKRVDAQQAAIREYDETGDPTKAIELGLFPPDTPHGKRG